MLISHYYCILDDTMFLRGMGSRGGGVVGGEDPCYRYRGGEGSCYRYLMSSNSV